MAIKSFHSHFCTLVMRVLILFFVIINYVIADFELPERKDAFTNDPVELKPVYHTPNAYEERSYDFWYENWPHPHVHGDKPLFDERHQHFPGYGDNYDFSNFITDPPSQLGTKSETVLEETSLVDEPSADKSLIKTNDTSEANKSGGNDEDLISDINNPKKSIDQPKKDYETPSEPTVSGEKLSKLISSLPTEGSGDPYSSLSGISSSGSSAAISSSAASGSSSSVYSEGPKSSLPPGLDNSGKYGKEESSISSALFPYLTGEQSIAPSEASSLSTSSFASMGGRVQPSRSSFLPSSVHSPSPIPSGYPVTSRGGSGASATDYSSATNTQTFVNTETSGNPSKSSDVYSSSSVGNTPSSSANGPYRPDGGGDNYKPLSPIGYTNSNHAKNKGSEDEYYKSPPGVQPEVFPDVNTNAKTGSSYGGGGSGSDRPSSGSEGSSKVDEFFPEDGEQSKQSLPSRPTSSSSSSRESSAGIGGGGEGRSSGPRPCCPCCRDENLTPAIGAVSADDGCGLPNCGPPPIVGSPPVCCPQAPLPCCPRLPNCCLPQLPCCPRIQLTCCPPIQICCQPLNFGCGNGCRSRAVTRLRTKRNGCVPCLGRKKRDIEDVTHVRQKRLGCIPCLAREKRQAQQNCQKCNLFQDHVVRRVKRTFSCSSCATHHERVKRQSQIASFYQGNQLGAYRNCKQCYDLPLPQQRAMKKRSAGFSEIQHEFLARIKRASEGYDPLFQCDSGCCDYEKCIRSKPLRSETFKVPEDSDFISGSSSKDYDLPDFKEDKTSDGSSSTSIGIGARNGDSKRDELIGSKDALSLNGNDKDFRS